MAGSGLGIVGPGTLGVISGERPGCSKPMFFCEVQAGRLFPWADSSRTPRGKESPPREGGK